MRISENFTLEELCKTNTGLANVPDSNAVRNLVRLATCILQPLRDAYGKPIYVNSGYRSQAVNQQVKGAKNSQHLLGQAADITAGSAQENKRLFNLIQSLELPFDQLIDERNYSWIHVSYSSRQRKQVLYIK